MESPTQEDSLIFANESRVSSHNPPPTDWNPAYEPTQADPVPLKASSPAESPASLRVSRPVGSITSTEEDTVADHIVAATEGNKSSQKGLGIFGAPEHHGQELSRPDTTYSPGSAFDLRSQSSNAAPTISNDIMKNPAYSRDSSSPHAQGTMGGFRAPPNGIDTQPIYLADTQRIEPDTQRIIPDTQVIAAGTQIIDHVQNYPDHGTETTDASSDRNPGFPIPDTQVIANAPSAPQILGDTQVIGHGSEASPISSDPKILEPTQPDTTIADEPITQSTPGHLKTGWQDTQVDRHTQDPLSSPSKNSRPGNGDISKGDSLIFCSPNQSMNSVDSFANHIVTRPASQHSPDEALDYSPFVEHKSYDLSLGYDNKDQPTTQVLNTQEDARDVILSNAVDLGCRPIFSSSQGDDGKRQISEYSIVSNDTGFESDAETSHRMYEDSVAKKRRLGARYQQLDIISDPSAIHSQERFSSRDSGSISSPNFDNSNSTYKVESQKLPSHVSSQDPLERSSDGLRHIRRRLRKTPLNCDIVSSSSELEEIKNDVSSLDFLDMGEGIPSVSQEGSNAPAIEHTTLRHEATSVISHSSIKVQNAVWAFSQFRYFPARVLQFGELTSFVEYSNGIQQDVKNTDLLLLDIRIGDTVQLSARLDDFKVTGLSSFSSKSTFRCVRGYDTVILSKIGRHGVKREEVMIAIRDICMDIGQWAKHKQDYSITFDNTNMLQEAYPMVIKLLELVKEPTPAEGKLKEKTLVSPKKSTQRASDSKSEIFRGMLFFATSIEGDRKDKLVKLITAHGGVFIEDDIKQYLTESTKDGQLCLSSNDLAQFEFGALLSDGFSRSAKYLQALALGWPILADTFIEKSIENQALLTQWQVFLLPSGKSTYTNTLASRDIHQFRVKHSGGGKLSLQLDNNAGLLKGKTMIILNKKQDDMVLGMCRFIFHAYGAKRIEIIDNVSDIDKDILKSDEAFVLDNSASEYLASHSKTRKKAKKTRVGVIHWEWVVQCVISNFIWDCETYIKI